MTREYLKSISEALKSLINDDSLPEPIEEEQPPESIDEQLDFSEIMEEATEHFTYRPDLGERRKGLSDTQFEMFTLDGPAPVEILYRVTRPTELLPTPTHGYGRIRFLPENRQRDFEDIIREAAKRKETSELEVIDENKNFHAYLAEFYLSPEEIETVPEIHESAAEMGREVYRDYIGQIIDDLEETDYVPGAIEKDYFDDENEWNLKDEEQEYKEAAKNYISEFPNLVKAGVHSGFLLTEALEENRNRLE